MHNRYPLNQSENQRSPAACKKLNELIARKDIVMLPRAWGEELHAYMLLTTDETHNYHSHSPPVPITNLTGKVADYYFKIKVIGKHKAIWIDYASLLVVALYCPFLFTEDPYD